MWYIQLKCYDKMFIFVLLFIPLAGLLFVSTKMNYNVRSASCANETEPYASSAINIQKPSGIATAIASTTVTTKTYLETSDGSDTDTETEIEREREAKAHIIKRMATNTKANSKYDALESLNNTNIKCIALQTTICTLLVSILIFSLYDFSSNQFQFVQEYYEINTFNLYLGIDGLSMYFVLLTTFIMPISLLSN